MAEVATLREREDQFSLSYITLHCITMLVVVVFFLLYMYFYLGVWV